MSEQIENVAVYPETYLHVREERSGEEWIMAIAGEDLLDLTTLIKKWLKVRFSDELRLDGKIWERGDALAQFSARIMMDGRPPDSLVCWTSCGFWVKGFEE